MKKILLASLLGTSLLASCGDITVSRPLSNLNVTSYTTSWQLDKPVSDQNGQTLASGSYIICDNLNTEMQVHVTWTGELRKLALQFKGVTTGTQKIVSTQDLGYGNTSGSGGFTYTFGAGLAPLGSGTLNAQSIVVNPKTVTVKGYTYVNAQGIDSAGNLSNIAQSANSIPVADCTQ